MFVYVESQLIAGKDRPVMDWGTRLKLAIGAAKGLAYLHEACESSATLHFLIGSCNFSFYLFFFFE